MATFYMRTSPITTIMDIQRKLTAFKELYGTSTVVAKGVIATTDKKDPYIFADLGKGVEVAKIGKKYLTVIADGEPMRVYMGNPNHGIKEIVFMTDNQVSQ